MSPYKETLNIFVHLLENYPELFTATDKLELEKLLADQPNEEKAIANTISAWLENHPDIDDAIAEFESGSRSSKGPGIKKANPNISNYQVDKKSIINAVQKSSHGEDKKEKQK